MTTASILDPVHPGLAPEIWDHPEDPEPVLKPHVADFIKHTIYHVLETNGYSSPRQWLKLVVTGSLTTFQYGPDSDMDVSLFVDSQVFPEWSRAEMFGVMVEQCDGTLVPGSHYGLQDYVVPAHIKPANLYRPGLRSGWSIDEARWIVPPERSRIHNVEQEENVAYVEGLQAADKMERLLRYEPSKAVIYYHQIHAKRKRDQEAGKGDFAQSNVVYKFLEQRGLMPEIAQVEKQAQDGFGYSPMGEEPLDQPLKSSMPRRTATTLPKSKIPVGKMTPEQVAEYKAAQEYAKNGSLAWLRDNPRSPDNIVNHWNQTTPEHRAQGMSWYQDAHRAAEQIAQDRGITVNQAAGLIANYSPQQHWATNLEMASRAAAGQVIGGPKQPGQRGFMASRSQAEAAARIMSGEDYHNIFAGKKITSFGHLIEHGQDTDPNDPKVVVDRHALAVAHGGYADDGVYTYSKVSSGVRKDGSSPAYDDVSNMYKQAADTINANGGYNGVPIQPHQLQAATWLTRQRLNAEGGYSGNDPAVANRTRKVAEASVNNWNAYAAENHPALVGKTPGTGFSTNTGAGGLGTQAEPVDPTLAKIADFGDSGMWSELQPIRPSELSSPTAIERGHSRPVSPDEWHQAAQQGMLAYEDTAAQADGTHGLDANWPQLKQRAWQNVQEPWGGDTINAATGQPIEGTPDLYALTAKPQGVSSVSIPIGSPQHHFDAAMDEARQRFGDVLNRQNHHLGIFRDEDVNRIDFDPVLVVNNLRDAENIGAHTRNIGGAYHFASGDGFWPPHVPDEHLAAGTAWDPVKPYPSYAQFRSANRTELAPIWTPLATRPQETW